MVAMESIAPDAFRDELSLPVILAASDGLQIDTPEAFMPWESWIVSRSFQTRTVA